MFISSSVGRQLRLPGDSNKELDLSLSTRVAEAGRSLKFDAALSSKGVSYAQS